MQKHCGELMQKFEYGKENEWIEKLRTNYNTGIA